MNYSRTDIDALIRKFKAGPSEDLFQSVKSWYDRNCTGGSGTCDAEYGVCVYLFLLGANIKHRYVDFTYAEHCDYIREIRDAIERVDPLIGNTRKVYLDYGSKAGGT